MDERAMRELVLNWFRALDARNADALVDMCNPDVVIRPFLARQPVEAVGYHGHDGVRDWTESLESATRIELKLIDIEVTSPQSAVVEAEVWFEREGSRTGGLTFSLWRFEGGKLSEAIGYGAKEDALDAEAGGWH